MDDFTRYPVRPTPPLRLEMPIASDEIPEGRELHSYTRKEPIDDGKYILVTKHSEHLEKVQQPLTPEEKAAQARETKIILSVLGTIAAGFFGLVGYTVYKDEQAYKKRTGETEKPKS